MLHIVFLSLYLFYFAENPCVCILFLYVIRNMCIISKDDKKKEKSMKFIGIFVVLG